MARLLTPFSIVTRLVTANRVGRRGWVAPVPVICCGNATVGGSGKTPVCLDIAARLTARGRNVHTLTRGYGGVDHVARRVDVTSDTALVVGDEALLLAELSPVWVGADRAASARAAVAAGADVILMDDGLQNPSLQKTASLLIVDGVTGFGNGHLLPAGPLREPVAAAVARCRAAVVIGRDQAQVLGRLSGTIPVLTATMQPDAALSDVSGKPVVAFAGIGHPEKFFTMLRGQGVVVAMEKPFADHHPFSDAEMSALVTIAQQNAARLVCTRKDYVRVPRQFRGEVTPVGLRLLWDDPSALDGFLTEIAA